MNRPDLHQPDIFDRTEWIIAEIQQLTDKMRKHAIGLGGARLSRSVGSMRHMQEEINMNLAATRALSDALTRLIYHEETEGDGG